VKEVMAKKNLKHALRKHEARVIQENKVKAAEEAAKRRAISIRSGKKPRAKGKDGQITKSFIQPFAPQDTILLVGEGEQ
jgi:hypothetical protein